MCYWTAGSRPAGGGRAGGSGSTALLSTAKGRSEVNKQVLKLDVGYNLRLCRGGKGAEYEQSRRRKPERIGAGIEDLFCQGWRRIGNSAIPGKSIGRKI